MTGSLEIEYSMPTDEHTRPIGVVVTIKEIYDTVQSIDAKMDSDLRLLREEISKLKAQLAAQWVVHGILVAAIIFLTQKGLS